MRCGFVRVGVKTYRTVDLQDQGWASPDVKDLALTK
uniref:Uncharacterized protein n=1 Tax=Anguilla anguilla TaxID=7936 RepID=A0A0E9WBC8_ANGAN